ncbi:FK506-binding protein 15-like isoform X4 [Podarcis raffonei]|uniref:FK506-binding protein 15-like isoform X4 n=1 Tax=Podarcis raffonei TaxID=65483 RepID=UPI002329607D|nr:FK506-binding protein 15-like isoform X4 [Podarcis raffonei]
MAEKLQPRTLRLSPPGLGLAEGRGERGAVRMLGDMDEEDDAFQLPTGGTRLASLFGQDQTTTESGNVLFQYMPPKQPKKGQPATAAGLPTQKHPPAAAAAAPTAVPAAAAPAPTAAVHSVFFATAVHAYLFTNGKYVKHGKYGAAVVGSNATKEYRVLLYISKQQQIATARIDAWFVFTVQHNNYCTFYDDQRQNWSIMFESEVAAVDFSKQLCIAKYNSSRSHDSVLCQDLVLGDGQGVATGDVLEITFTGWLFQNGSLGQVFDSNVNKEKLLRLKLGSGKVIKGWEDGMIGMKRGGRRFLLIPPALAYGSSGEAERIPPDSTLAFEVEVKRVRFAKGADSAGQSQGPRDSLTPSPAPQSESPATDPAWLTPPTPAPKPGEPAVRAKSSSISGQLANPDVTKVKLISRMAKMGQPMLPVPSSTFAPQQDSADKEVEEPHAIQEFSTFCPNDYRPMAPPQWTTQAPHPAVSGLQVPAAPQPHPPLPRTPQNCQPYAGMPYAYPQVSAAVSQLQPVGLCPAPFQVFFPVTAAGDLGSFLLTETRQQNTEIRLAVGKVADKMDQLSVKLEELRKQNSGPGLLPGISSVTMETSMIMSNIQRILQENERLKQEIVEKSSRIEEQNNKIGELIDRNQRYVEQSNLLSEQSNSSLQRTMEHTQARVLHAEQEKHMPPLDQGWDQVRVTKELAEATAQITQLQLELTRHQKQEIDLHSQLNEALTESGRQKALVNQLQAQLAELQKSSDDMKSRYQEEKLSGKKLDEKVAALEEELADIRIKKENLEKLSLLKTTRSSENEKLPPQQEQPEPVKGKVKKIMNEVFQSLRGQFNLEESYTGQEVLRIVLNAIKTTTLQLLESQEEQRGSSSTEEEGPAERKQPSAAPLYGDPHSNSLREPAPVASPAPLANLKESSSSPPSTALEGAQGRLLFAAPEAHSLEAPVEQTRAASAQTARPPLRLSARTEKERPSTQGEMDTKDTAILAPPNPAADEMAPAMEGPTMGPEGKEESGASQHTAGPTSQAALADKQQDLAGASQPRPASSPTEADSSLLEDKGGFFKAATPKPCALGTLLVEDDDDEFQSLKGRPPPTPLFDDDDDDDDDL